MVSGFIYRCLSAAPTDGSGQHEEALYPSFDTLPDGYASCNERYDLLFCNQALRHMAPGADWSGCQQLFDVLETLTGQRFQNHINAALLQQRCHSFNFQQPHTNALFQFTLIPSSPGLLLHVRLHTEKMQQAINLTGTYRHFELVTKLNDLALQESNEAQLFQQACDIAVNVGGFKLAWIGMPNEQETAIAPQYKAGQTDYLNNVLNIPLDDSPLSKGPTGTAFNSGMVFRSDDILTDPLMAPWRYLAIEHGFRSSVALPIKVDGRVKAIWSLYSDQPHWFNDQELSLLKQTAANLAFSLAFHRHRRQQADTAEQLRIVNRAVEQSNASVVITNIDGNIEYVNPAFCRLTGYTEAEALGQNPRILKSGITSENEYKQMWEVISKKQSWQGEFCNKKKNGELYWENATITPILNDQGDITHYLAVKENITERKNLEEAQKRLLEIIDNTTTYVTIIDMNHRFIFANRAFRKANGLRYDEDISQYSISDIHTEIDKNIAQQIAVQLSQTGIWQGENAFKNKLGETVNVWQVVSAHLDSNGLPTHISSTAVDITRLKEAQLETLLLTDELRALSNHLQQTREQEKREIASQLHDQLGQLVAAIKIDASWIQRHLKAAENEVLNSRLQRLLENIEETGKSFHRVHATLQPAMLEELGLISAIEWMIEHVLPSGTVQLRFTTNLTDHDKLPAPIALTIYRAIQECLSNISKHAQAGKVEVDLRSHTQQVVLTIDDDGIGFDTEQVDTRLKHGLLGLRERVFAIHGQLEIQSVPGEGTGTHIQISIPL
ncbi:MAG: PAS domain S-box protein [Chitinophagaceae bacterium]|nr:PAS domain S-box protein [Chitinophagaceae bacterium]